MRNLAGSQQRWMRVGVMSCLGLVRVRTPAAEFCTNWSLSRVLLGTPDTGCNKSTDERLCYSQTMRDGDE